MYAFARSVDRRSAGLDGTTHGFMRRSTPGWHKDDETAKRSSTASRVSAHRTAVCVQLSRQSFILWRTCTRNDRPEVRQLRASDAGRGRSRCRELGDRAPCDSSRTSTPARTRRGSTRDATHRRVRTRAFADRVTSKLFHADVPDSRRGGVCGSDVASAHASDSGHTMRSMIVG